MRTGTTLFKLQVDNDGIFDGSNAGIAIPRALRAEVLPDGAGVSFDGGVVEISRHKNLDDLQTFTIEATLTPARIGPARQNIVEGQSPAVALYLAPEGKLVGSLYIDGAWKGLDSGKAMVAAGRTTRVRFTRDEEGKTELSIDDQVVATKRIPGALQKAGELGLRLGAWTDGSRFAFSGQINDLSVRQGAVSPSFLVARREKEKAIAGSLSQELKRVHVSLAPDESYERLQPIKIILQAAGVDRLSDLLPLSFTKKTVMTPGAVLVAARKGKTSTSAWEDAAGKFRTADAAQRRNMLALLLANQSSRQVLARAKPLGRARPEADGMAMLQKNVLAADPSLLDQVMDRNPASWPAIAEPAVRMVRLKTIPVDNAVIIAGTLDLTESQLVIEPNVEKLIIIAEKVICGKDAAITWRRPGGETPPRGDDPDLNGRGWSGIHSKPNSRDGLDGENGGSGAGGLTGAPGRHAPHLEMWVKNMTGMPNLDLNGEDGRNGGRGQHGGRGGQGADGVWGRSWPRRCKTEGGDGGDGGDGGSGGAGGRGGKGGNGGKITIAVLDEDTLDETMKNKPFTIKNEGARPGRGGAGGAGGAGGRQGRSGSGGHCTYAEHGHAGAEGQPGAVGPDGFSRGKDGDVEYLGFDEDVWDELLTRPWLTEVSPEQAFPGDRLTLRGSRFTTTDVVFLGGSSVPHTINADENLSVTIPTNPTGGEKSIFVRRTDGTESNRILVSVKPQLDRFEGVLNPGARITLTGHAFSAGAAVLIDGAAHPATVVNRTKLWFQMPGTGGEGMAGSEVEVQVRNPDGLVSNARTTQIPRILEVPFRYGKHNLPFGNFTDGIPSWDTYKDTFGAAEIWHEQLDPVFGHPILTAAFFGFYRKFLKGTANGGHATGFCTSLASLVADRFWQGRDDTISVTKASVHKWLTAVHGRLLSRESLISLHAQSRQETARVEQSYREIEATFLRGCDRHNAPLLFFLPSGAAWDAGYRDKLDDSHCVMPWRFVYPPGRVPKLSADETTTLTNLDGVEMYVWDCNKPASANCRLVFRQVKGKLLFEYFPDQNKAKFSSQKGITLGMMTLGDYLLADHDLPFTGPFGLQKFVLDFLLSPADLRVTDANGLRTGRFSRKLLSEIPDSRPCYLAPGCYMLPENTALTRRIVGRETGTYSYQSILPSGGSLVLENVTTARGQEDVLAVSADAHQIRFTPAAEKAFTMTLARMVGTQARALAIQGAGGGPAADIDVSLSPDLSLLRLGNRGAARSVEVQAFSIDRGASSPANRQFAALNLPADHDLTVAVTDWTNLDAAVETLSFE